MKTYLLTLCLIYNDKRILLGMKKRGFGAGRWNGFGGKVHEGEMYEAAAIREVNEEAGIIPVNIRPRGELIFHMKNDDVTHHVHLFAASEFVGEPRESEEMSPRWFSHKDIPFDAMWPDDKYWIPLILSGKNLKGKFFFKDMDTLVNYQINELD